MAKDYFEQGLASANGKVDEGLYFAGRAILVDNFRFKALSLQGRKTPRGNAGSLVDATRLQICLVTLIQIILLGMAMENAEIFHVRHPCE